MYTTVPVLKLAYLLISILMTLYTFLWCMGIRPSTSDISSLFIYFLLFWFLQLWLTAKVRETLELKKFSTFSLLVFFLFREMHFSCLVKLLSSWSLYLPHQFVTLRIFFIHRYTQIEREPMHTIDNFFEKCSNRLVQRVQVRSSRSRVRITL